MNRTKDEIVVDRIQKLSEAYGKIDTIIDSLPEQVPEQIKSFVRDTVLGNKELKSLFEDLENNRPPRILMVGRTGYGKSSIINALCGAYVAQVSAVDTCTSGVEIYQIKDKSRVLMEIMDSRGLSESNRIDGTVSAEDQFKSDVIRFDPDVLIFVLNCATRDSSIDEDVTFIDQIRRDYFNYAFIQLPVIVALNKADTVSPARETDPRFFSEIKLKNISDIEKRYKILFMKKEFKPEKTIAISSSVAWGIDGQEIGESDIPYLSDSDYERLRIISDGRYNIDKLRESLEEAIQDNAARAGLKLALRMDDCIMNICRQINNSFVAVSAAVSASPIPFSDIYVLMLLQTFDVFLIQALSGKPANFNTARDFLKGVAGVAGAAYVFRQIARESIKFLPGPGTAISSAVAATGTKAIGDAAIAYYIKDEDFEGIKKKIKKIKIEEGVNDKFTISISKNPLKPLLNVVQSLVEKKEDWIEH